MCHPVFSLLLVLVCGGMVIFGRRRRRVPSEQVWKKAIKERRRNRPCSLAPCCTFLHARFAPTLVHASRCRRWTLAIFSCVYLRCGTRRAHTAPHRHTHTHKIQLRRDGRERKPDKITEGPAVSPFWLYTPLVLLSTCPPLLHNRFACRVSWNFVPLSFVGRPSLATDACRRLANLSLDSFVCFYCLHVSLPSAVSRSSTAETLRANAAKRNGNT